MKEKEKKDDPLTQQQRVALKLAELSKPTLVAIMPTTPSCVPPISKNLLRLHNMYSKRLQTQIANHDKNSHQNTTIGLDIRRRQLSQKKQFDVFRKPKVRFEDIISIDLESGEVQHYKDAIF